MQITGAVGNRASGDSLEGHSYTLRCMVELDCVGPRLGQANGGQPLTYDFSVITEQGVKTTSD
jgi:hypothetical protein